MESAAERMQLHVPAAARSLMSMGMCVRRGVAALSDESKRTTAIRVVECARFRRLDCEQRCFGSYFGTVRRMKNGCMEKRRNV